MQQAQAMTPAEWIAIGIALAAIIVALVVARRPAAALPQGVVQALADLGALKDRLAEHSQALARIGERLAGSAEVESAVKTQLGQAHELLQRLQADYQARLAADEQARASLRRVESIIAGGAAKGRAGENILAEAFKAFPAEMLQCDCHIGGKVVEFALVLSDGRLLPIDSKWPAADLLEALDRETEPDARARVAAEIEKVVAKRANEVAQYIDAERTLPWAIAAIPDAAYAVCRKVHLDAYTRGVIVLSYGMAVPFLLTLFGLYLRYTRGVDMENVHARLIEMGRVLDAMEQSLETKMQRGATMVANAITDYQRAIFALRACIEAMQAMAPHADGAPPPPAPS